jgi:hypothetical protein
MNSKLLLLIPLATIPFARAIDIVDSGASGAYQVNLAGTYTQNFDSLVSSGSGGVPFSNDTTLPGWYSQLTYGANQLSGLSSFGTDSDRALGSTGAYWALRLANASTQLITGLSVSYTGEQWYRGANNPQSSDRIYFYYRIYDSSVTLPLEIYGIGGISNWNEVNLLEYDAPNATATSASMLDGNLPENSVNVSFNLSGIVLAPGEKIWLKWISSNRDGVNDHALAIDDLNISFFTAAIPEPAATTALLGLATLSFAASRRKARP